MKKIPFVLFVISMLFMSCNVRIKSESLENNNMETSKDLLLQFKISVINARIKEICITNEEIEAGTESKIPSEFVVIPYKDDILMLSTEVTQKLYNSVVGFNPSFHKGENNPVEMVSWYDAINFCNILSQKCNLEPVYTVKYDYNPFLLKTEIDVTPNLYANGFRLPTLEEMQFAAGSNTYSGSNNLNQVGWYCSNSDDQTHPVAQKKANEYGLYDISGNVEEWVWNENVDEERYYCGGGFYNKDFACNIRNTSNRYENPELKGYGVGFRIVCSANAFEEDKQNALEAGMNGHLSKPINIKEMKKEIERILN